MQSKFLRLPEVLKRYGLARTTIYDLVAKAQFPQPIHVGRSSLWNCAELDSFDDKRANERQSQRAGQVGTHEAMQIAGEA
jgi:predicted DNA-binding transcriptional regulator AlpA